MADNLPAGSFCAWVTDALAAIRGDRAADVACGGCTACCRSSQFVHIEPDESETLARIPRRLLFPAPRRPPGHMVLGYDQRGWCPMLTDAGCSIYEHRPRTCRTYDCRVFAAADVRPDDQDDIERQARRWRFTVADAAAAARLKAVRAAARYLARHPELLPAPGATQRAVTALEVHALFLEPGADPRPDEVAAALALRAPRGS